MSILTNSVLVIFAGGFLVLCAVVHGLMEAIGWVLRMKDGLKQRGRSAE